MSAAPMTYPPIRTDRGTYIPTWYSRHSDLEVPVTDEGALLGFRVKDVAEERRWAIREDGRLMDQLNFERQYRQWLSENYIHSNAEPRETAFDPIPNVRAFVKGPDPVNQSRLVDLPYEHGKPAPKIERLYTADGEKWKSPEQVEKEKAEREAKEGRDAQATMLAQMHKEGLITKDVFARKLSELFVSDEPEVAVAAPAEERPEKAKTMNAPCGKEIARQGSHFHIRKCEECKRIQASEPPAEE